MVFFVSIVAFVVMELPPGDFLTNYVANLEAEGLRVTQEELDSLERRYGLGQPSYIRYFKWAGGFFTGDLGLSMYYNRPVSELIGERLFLTITLTFVTILFTWVVAIPIGLYSALRQYSPFDYAFTVVGFLGLSIPNFLLALVIMFVAFKYFGLSVSGLFSAEFVGEPWSFAKFLDLLSNIWVAVVVVGTAGTAGTIRVLRSQMLDELGKDYVKTARAKGLAEGVVILKHALRLAINPVISRIGWMLPALFSGATITAIVLNLPTVGPLLLDALRNEDMHLGASVIMIQTILVVIGTLISDILLAVVDPRIRYT